LRELDMVHRHASHEATVAVFCCESRSRVEYMPVAEKINVKAREPTAPHGV